MKKFCKLITFVLVIGLLLLTPTTPLALNALAQFTAAAETKTNQYTAPKQDNILTTFEPVDTYDLATWNKPTGNYLVSQQVTETTNNAFHEKYANNTLTNADIIGHAPYVIATNTPNLPANGTYSTNAITLSANGYYQIAVDYYVVEQKDNQTNIQAFGTFYLNDQAITLLPQNQWATAYFYIRTDKLETATITPELYFGARNVNALGAVYFDRFTVNAVNQEKFTDLVDTCDPTCYLDFAHDSAYVLEQEFVNADFSTTSATNGESYNDISTANVFNNLGIQQDNQPQLYPKSGNNSNVMLLKATNADATLTLENYTFQPNPHEIYMFQFYSIATAAEDFSGFYFKIGSTAQEIPNLTSYPYHNGWQLNTLFFIAGQALDQEYQLSFTLGNGSATTGWACIDEFKIYKVNGSYATQNATAVGVHGTYDMNADGEALDVANGYFDLGTASDNVNNQGSSYPYPLIADSWTTNTTTNGIVNLTFWDNRFGSYPNLIQGYDANNNVYMLKNTNPTTNTVTSPTLSTTIGSTTYVSFDACGYNASKTRAYIISTETDDDGNTTKEIVLGCLDINNNAWHHYEFAIAESEYATSRNYYLRFEMTGIGYAYIDNVRATTDGAFQYAPAAQTDATTIDLNNPLALNDLWQAADEITPFYCDATKNGLTLANENGQKTVVKNAFAYNFTADNYYEIVINARGENAYLGFSSYDGLLQVTTDEVNEDLCYQYKLYLHPSDEATTINLQITLGSITNDTNTAPIADGKIFINQITINSITEDEFNNASENADNDARLKVLSLTSNTDEDSDNDVTEEDPDDNSFFGENWWYLVPTLITAFALLLAIGTFLFRKIKFERHITKKNTSYARDMRLKNQQKKIVAQKATKVDNVTDESQSN